jgi:hypothetical protein
VTPFRCGDWKPGAVSPALLTVQLVATFQAALRGLDYWRGTGPTPPALALVESAAPPTVWAALLMGGSALVLVGLAGRWASTLIVAHLLLAAVYIGVGAPVLAASSVGPLTLGLSVVAAAAAGTWGLLRHPSGVVRAAAVPVMLSALIGASTALGSDYRTGTGLVGAGLIHAALAAGVALGTVRRRAAEAVELEVTRE